MHDCICLVAIALAETGQDVFLEIISPAGQPSTLQSPPRFLHNRGVWDPVVELLEWLRNQPAMGIARASRFCENQRPPMSRCTNDATS